MSAKFKKIISLRFFVMLTIAVLSFVPIIIIEQITGYAFRVNSMEQTIADVKKQCSILSKEIAAGTFLTDQNDTAIKTEIELISNIYSARIMIIDSKFTIVSDNYVFDEGKIIITESVLSAFKGNINSSCEADRGTAEISMPIVDIDGRTAGVINVNLTDHNMLSTAAYIDKVTDALKFVFVLIIITASSVLTHMLVRPAMKIGRAISGITVGVSNSEIGPQKLYEYQYIASSVNGLLNRLNTIDSSRDEFVSNVSHELKTPMTSMKVLADSLLAQDNVPEDIYKDFLQDIVSEVDRENHIINNLLTLVKTDRSNPVLNIETVNINGLVERILKNLKPIAVAGNVELVLESVRPVAAQIDELQFTMALNNLLENAIKYNRENGYVRVSVNADHKFFYLRISDSGIGIPAEYIDKIFERFYRVDKARSRQTGGTGLGLSITRNIIILHKGTIKVYSKENEGTTFTIRVPLNYVGGTEV